MSNERETKVNIDDNAQMINIINATAFEKGKTYMLKVSGKHLKEHEYYVVKYAIKGLIDAFKERGIDVIINACPFDIDVVEIKEQYTNNGGEGE